MAQYQEGLNYIPLLAQNISPPSSVRSRISITTRSKGGSQNSFICFNGNYEGDISMFRDKAYELERLSLIDSESDTELQKEIMGSTSISTLKNNRNNKTSIMWRLFQYFMLHFLTPELRVRISNRLDNMMDSPLYKIFKKGFSCITFICIYMLNFSLIFFNYLMVVYHVLWKRRLIFRNVVRRLLWFMTLAKCNDFTLFTLILCCTPFLFVLASLGFIISFFGYLKELLQHWGCLIKIKLM